MSLIEKRATFKKIIFSSSNRKTSIFCGYRIIFVNFCIFSFFFNVAEFGSRGGGGNETSNYIYAAAAARTCISAAAAAVAATLLSAAGRGML